jgi:hypothetical protein
MQSKIKTHLTFSSVEEARKEFPLDTNHWLKLGSPHIWCTVEERNGYTAQIDIAYGQVRLMKKDKEISSGKFMCAAKDIICLDIDYYGLTKYLWT